MEIVSKTIVRWVGSFAVVEGDVMTPVGEVTYCWVERDGIPISPFTDIDTAMELAGAANNY